MGAVPADDEESLGPFSALDGAIESLEHDSAEPAPLALPLPLVSAAAPESVTNSSGAPAVAGLAWYCWEGSWGGELVCDWGEGEEYCYYDGWDIDGEWWYCDDDCYINWDGFLYWRVCECPPGYYWDDWSWECYPDEEEYELSVGGTGAGSGTVYSDVGGISCDITGGTAEGACSEYYFSTEVVTLSASAWDGSTFSGWSGNCSGSGDCYVTMSGARNVTASFSEQPTVFQLRCGAFPGGTPSNSISVVRATFVNCEPVRISGPTTATADVTGWEFVPLLGSNTFGIGNVTHGAGQSWGGRIVARGTVNADVTIGSKDTTLSAVISNVTHRTGFPQMTAQRLYQDPILETFHTPAQNGQEFLAGEVPGGIFDGNADQGSVLIAVESGGPNAGYFYALNSFIVHTPRVRINENGFKLGSNLYRMAGTPPAWPQTEPASPPFTNAWCTQTWIANSMLAQTEQHEGTSTQTDSHTWARREYLSSPAVGGEAIRWLFERFVIGAGDIDLAVIHYIISPLNMEVYSISHTHNAASMQQCRPIIRAIPP